MATKMQVGGWYGGQQFNGTSLGPKGVVTVGNGKTSGGGGGGGGGSAGGGVSVFHAPPPPPDRNKKNINTTPAVYGPAMPTYGPAVPSSFSPTSTGQLARPVNPTAISAISSSDRSWPSLVKTATQVAKEFGIHPAVMVGQMALESGRGGSNFAQNRNNLFGYQAYDSNPDAAKGYKTPLDSMIDYAKLITGNPRYKEALKYADQPIQQIQAIKNAGYATDPNYVHKIVNLPEFQALAKNSNSDEIIGKALASADTGDPLISQTDLDNGTNIPPHMQDWYQAYKGSLAHNPMSDKEDPMVTFLNNRVSTLDSMRNSFADMQKNPKFDSYLAAGAPSSIAPPQGNTGGAQLASSGSVPGPFDGHNEALAHIRELSKTLQQLQKQRDVMNAQTGQQKEIAQNPMSGMINIMDLDQQEKKKKDQMGMI